MASLEEESSLNVIERYEFKHLGAEGLVSVIRTAALTTSRIDAHAEQRDACEALSFHLAQRLAQRLARRSAGRAGGLCP